MKEIFHGAKQDCEKAGQTFHTVLHTPMKGESERARILSDGLFSTCILRVGEHGAFDTTLTDSIKTIATRYANTAIFAPLLRHAESAFLNAGFVAKNQLSCCMRERTEHTKKRIPAPNQNMKEQNMQQNNGDQHQVLQTTDKVSKKGLIDLYVSVGFGERHHYEHLTDMIERMFGDGVFGFFVHQDQHLVGMARVYSDDTSVSWIAEITVRPDQQGNGIGSAILKAVNERFRHTDLYVQPFVGQERFFVKGGIPARPQMAVCGRASDLSKADQERG